MGEQRIWGEVGGGEAVIKMHYCMREKLIFFKGKNLNSEKKEKSFSNSFARWT